MLNEIGEYEQYTYPLTPQEIKNHQDNRLKYLTLIKRQLAGLERAMTIVARHFMFDVLHCDSHLTEDDFNELRKILKVWCGFNPKDNKDPNELRTPLPDHFNGWLVNYIYRTFLTEKVQTCLNKISLLESPNLQNALSDQLKKILSQENINTCNDPSEEMVKALKDPLVELKYLQSNHGAKFKTLGNEPNQIILLLETILKVPGKNKYFSKNVFGGGNAKDSGNFRAITYDKIIANALMAGKLRRYYLTCDEDLFGTKKIFKSVNKSKALSATDMDMVLKMTAEYLLKRRYTSQNFIETNDSILVNWIKGTRKPEDFNRESYLLADSEENIFEVSMLNGIKALKVRLHPQWIKHFRLIEDGPEATEETLGRIFFSDTGSSAYLRKGILYTENCR